jgi:hypothetical protein
MPITVEKKKRMTNQEQNSYSDRRGCERLPCQQYVALTILIRPKMQKFEVTVHDVSHTGIGFLLDAPLKVGTVLALQRRIYVPGQSWIRSGKVTHATQLGDKWLMGCELSPPFSQAELASLSS